MDFIKFLIDFILHIDVHLAEIISEYGVWTIAILFLIVFLETGFVVTPFLPGDSLLFAAGAFAARGAMDPWVLFFALIIAAISGDTVNYWIGHKVGGRAFTGEVKWIKKEYMEKTHEFFEKHGGKTIFLARFVPIIRTFAPFFAGASRMNYPFFVKWNVIGGLVWVGSFIFLGYFFGNLPFVQSNFKLVIIAIIILSVLPIVWEFYQARKKKV